MATILIVDDSIIMRRNLRSLLTQAGHEVIAEASNGLQSFHQYEKFKPDLVTMDITMPVMNGIDGVKKIMNDFPEANIIMISALDQKMMVFDAIQSGAKHYILKPITVGKILSAINDVLGLNEVQPEEQGVISIAVTQEGMTMIKQDHEQIPTHNFEIQNRNGIFHVQIYNELLFEDIKSIRSAIHGLLLIKPLEVHFEMNKVSNFEGRVLTLLNDCKKMIEDVGGTVEMHE